MREFKFFQGYIGKSIDDEAFGRLMESLHELDEMVRRHNQGNYEIDDDISDWDVTLSDGLSEE